MNTIDRVYDTYCRKRFGLPTREDILDVQHRIGAPLPADYVEFLRRYNGGFFSEPDIAEPGSGAPVDSLVLLRGVHADEPFAELGRPFDLALIEDNDPPVVLPIGSTLAGFLIVLVLDSSSAGAIVLQTFSDSRYLADGIFEFFELVGNGKQ